MLYRPNRKANTNYFNFETLKGKVIDIKEGDLIDVLLIDTMKVIPVRLFTYCFSKISNTHSFRDRVDRYINKKRIIKRIQKEINKTNGQVYLVNTRFEEDGYLWSDIFLNLDDKLDLVSRIEN